MTAIHLLKKHTLLIGLLAAFAATATVAQTGAAGTGSASGATGGSAGAGAGAGTTGATMGGSAGAGTSGSSASGSNANGGKHSLARGDRKFVEEAAAGGMAEVAMGNVAQQKAGNDAVKQFGSRMVTDHTKANDELKSIASNKGIELPSSPTKGQQRDIEKMGKKSGADFDKDYMKHMVSDHKKDVKEFQKEAKSGKDPELQAFAQKTLPILQEHLQQAQTVNDQVKKAK